MRDAQAVDLPRIVEIYNESIPGHRATADLEPVTVTERQEWFDRHRPGRRPLWVIEADRSVAGWLSFEPFYGRAAYRATAEVSVYVAPEHHRRGIARALLRTALARGPELGIETLLAFVFSHNDPSIALFGQLGFERWGLLPAVARLAGLEADVVILGRALTAPR